MKALPIGVHDFRDIIDKNYYFVDKSNLIFELLNEKAKVTLITRPRRFGKTLNLSMLKYFFEKTDISHASLFNNLAINTYPEYMAHQGQYPVIFISFKDAKDSTWQGCQRKIINIIVQELYRYAYLLEGPLLNKTQKKEWHALVEKDAPLEMYAQSLFNISEYLSMYHNKRAIILIDEYDAPIHAGYTHGYYAHVIEFMRSLLGAALKDNNYLEFAVMTGILRVAKESIFSGLNNLLVCSIIQDYHAKDFGFTHQEVTELLATYNLEHKVQELTDWYDGYTIGTHTGIYNPWSVLNYAKSKGIPVAYWVNTSDNALVQELIQKQTAQCKQEFEQLIQGIPVRVKLKEHIVFESMAHDREYLYHLLLSSGYLTYTHLDYQEVGVWADLKIPNIEIKQAFGDLIRAWYEQSTEYAYIVQDLITGNTENFGLLFQDFVASSMSSFDISGTEPERFYHAFVLGLIATLATTHHIRSNRESGHGRYDIMIIPKDLSKPGIIIEFKKVIPGGTMTIEDAARKAVSQINDRAYEQELRALGIRTIIKLGIAFEGKKVCVLQEG